MSDILFFILIMAILVAFRAMSYSGKGPQQLMVFEIMILIAGCVGWSILTYAKPAIVFSTLVVGWYLLNPIAYFAFQKNVSNFAGERIYTFPCVRNRYWWMLSLFALMAAFLAYVMFTQNLEGGQYVSAILLAELIALTVLCALFLRTDVEIYQNGILLPEKIFYAWNRLSKYHFLPFNTKSQPGVKLNLSVGWQLLDVFSCPAEKRVELEVFLAKKIGAKKPMF